MAAAPVPMTPPPSPGGGPPTGTSTPMASPAPPVEESPKVQQGTNIARQIMRLVVAMGKAFPTTAPQVKNIMDQMNEAASNILEESAQAQPAAPPQA